MEDRIEFILGDYFHVMPMLKVCGGRAVYVGVVVCGGKAVCGVRVVCWEGSVRCEGGVWWVRVNLFLALSLWHVCSVLMWCSSARPGVGLATPPLKCLTCTPWSPLME